jgi:O-antigen/teichoic acid export membrane protein
MQTLSTRVLNSLGWVFTNILALNLLQMLRVWILWKILNARDFGVNNMAWLAINFFTLLQDMGFSAAYIQRKTDLEKAISVVWYTNVGIRVVVYALLFALAPLIAEHLREPEVGPLLRAASLCILISSMGNACEVVLRKNFQFRTLLVIETLELVVQIAVQVAFALEGIGAWSLVYGNIAAVATKSLLLWWLSPVRIGRFDMGVAADMFHYAKHMTLSTLLIWLIMHMDNYFVGKVLGADALGFYGLAFTVAHLIATNVGRLLGSVLFPAFSEIGHDRDRARNAWLRAARYSMVVLVPMGVGLIVFSPEIVLGFFGRKCEIIILPISILAVFALCRGLGTTLGDLAKGIGKPGILTRIAFWHVVVMAPLLVVAVWAARPAFEAALGEAALRLAERKPIEAAILRGAFAEGATGIGLIWVSVVVSGTAFFAMALSFQLLSREVKFTAAEAIRALVPSFAAGAAMAAAGWMAKWVLGLIVDTPPLVRLVAAGGFSGVVYLLVIWFCFPDVASHLKSLLARRRSEMKPRLEKAGVQPLTSSQ